MKWTESFWAGGGDRLAGEDHGRKRLQGERRAWARILITFPEVTQLSSSKPGLFPPLMPFCLIKFKKRFLLHLQISLSLFFSCLAYLEQWHWVVIIQKHLLPISVSIWVFFKLFLIKNMLCLCGFIAHNCFHPTKLHPESDKGHQCLVKDLLARWLILLLLIIKLLLVNILLV